MSKFHVCVELCILMLLLAGGISPGECCTIAAVSGAITTDGRPLLFKNRDRSDVYNQEVRYFNDGSHGGYITIVTTGVDETTTAYAGVNDDGFTIVNADAPDIYTGSPQNDGPFMKQALMECGSVTDFEALLIATSGSRGHIWSNFGVIDRYGEAAIFETDDWGYIRYDAGSYGGYVVRTNFSFWGGGTPDSRCQRADLLISKAVGANQLGDRYMIEAVSKDIGGPPYLPCGEWPTTGPAVSRYKTRSSAVIHGVTPAEDSRLSTFWCILGEPSCGISVPLWSYAGTPPYEMLTPGAPAPMCVEIQEKESYCYANLTSDTTINTNELVGDDGESGIQGYSIPIDYEVFDDTEVKLGDWRSVFPAAGEMSSFESQTVSRMYALFDSEIAPEDAGVPNGDIAVSGTQSGTYLDTWASDNVYESIREEESVGSVKRRYSFLEHKWTVFVEGGSQITFYIEAYHTANNEGDDFVFAYSTDDINYTDMVVVTKTTDDDQCQVYPLPAFLSGNLYIRVLDTDRTKGNRVLDEVFIDRIYIESSIIPDVTPPIISNIASSGITSTSALITWDTDEYSNSVVRYDTDGGPVYDFMMSSTDMVMAHSVALSGLSPSTQYYYVVESTDASDNTATSSEYTFTTGGVSNEMHVSSIEMSQRPIGVFTKGVAEITIVDEDDVPVPEAAVTGHWSGLSSDLDYFTTEFDGVGFCESDKIKYAAGWFVFTIDDVTKVGWAYNPGANVETSDSTYASGGGPQAGEAGDLPLTFALSRSQPNPFSSRVSVRYAVPRDVETKMAIYDVCGRVVRNLIDGVRVAGFHETGWDGRDENGRLMTNGVYFLRMKAGSWAASEKLLLVR
ncbi:MAG: fibronectin type III domain-containing protein [candidate division WOR-3 bacterium]|nr:MAG: fibronectin type III domain-containing protein [candidate division WOR-3 bacterium]